MPRPPVRKTRKLAEAQRLGELMGELKFHKRKSLKESLREHIGKIIDTITFRDIVDVIAAAGIAPVIYNCLDKIDSLKNNLTADIEATAIGALIGTIIFPGIGTMLGGILATVGKVAVTDVTVSALSVPQSLKWLLAFGIAWCIVRWGDKMLSAGIGSLAGVVGLLVP